MPISYYSTNRHLNNVAGITPFAGKVSFKEALLKGQASDEGLFMPDTIPLLSLKDIQKLKGKPYRDTALLVAKAFLADEFPPEVLKKVVKDSYNYPVPLEEVKPRAYGFL
jgi:threonine synthase